MRCDSEQESSNLEVSGGDCLGIIVEYGIE